MPTKKIATEMKRKQLAEQAEELEVKLGKGVQKIHKQNILREWFIVLNLKFGVENQHLTKELLTYFLMSYIYHKKAQLLF